MQQHGNGAVTEWREGYSLPQEEYMSRQQFEDDLKMVGDTQWVLADHASCLKEPGQWRTMVFGDESYILVRGRDGELRGFYNVCRHRGSRICLEKEGRSSGLTCPYHGWTYATDGRLKGAPLMAPDFDKSEAGLKPIHVHERAGLVFVNFHAGDPPDFDAFIARFEDYLAPHGLDKAKVAARMAVRNEANWKLVVENFFECYHCTPSHKTYCSVHDKLKMLALGAGPGSGDAEAVARYEKILHDWEAEVTARGHFAGTFHDGPQSLHFQAGSRLPIADGFLTESLDGKPVAPLMGDYREFDGGQTAASFNPLSIALINNDYALLFRIVPISETQTDFEIIWLVNETADLEKDVDVERMAALWKITTAEDKKITDDNQLGVASRAYQPGRYSTQEARIADFGIWYRQRLDAWRGTERAAI